MDEEIEKELEKLNDPNISDEEKERISREALNAYSRALEEEFKQQSNDSPGSIPEFTLKYFKEHVPLAAATIVQLAMSSTSDSVRLNAADKIIKYGITESIKDGDPLQTLIDDLTANKGKSKKTVDTEA